MYGATPPGSKAMGGPLGWCILRDSVPRDPSCFQREQAEGGPMPASILHSTLSLGQCQGLSYHDTWIISFCERLLVSEAESPEHQGSVQYRHIWQTLSVVKFPLHIGDIFVSDILLRQEDRERGKEEV